MPGLGWRKNLKGEIKGKFLKNFQHIKGSQLMYKNYVPIL
jgi:hypothetical protein